MRRAVALAALLIALPAQSAEDFAYVRTMEAEPGAVVVDTRPLAACREKSLAGARCLPAEDFLGPHRRLPSARDLLWLLGTAGLSGDESVLVVGQDSVARDFVAGVLYVSGQRSVRVLAEPVARVLETGAAGPGRERGMIRETVFAAPMRDGLLVLRDELRTLRPQPMLLDGRTEGEYWGETVRSARGGHLPGAVSLPALQLRAAQKPVLPEGSPVAYAHDAYEGLAYLTLLIAGHKVPARLYAEGWAEWAADGALPADAVAYPERVMPAETQSQYHRNKGWHQSPQDGVAQRGTMLVAALALVLAAFAFGWYFRRSREAADRSPRPLVTEGNPRGTGEGPGERGTA